MTTYRFWSGLETIGGNIVEIKTNKARVICDFGMVVAKELHEKMEELSELKYLLETNQLPLIPKLFETEQFKNKVLDAGDDSIETAIFISHLHLDHMQGLKYLPKNVSVYLSQDSYTLFQALVEIDEEQAVQCTLIPFSFNQPILIEDIEVMPKLSDHDTIGSSAFFITAPDLKLIHSGDVRLSGNHPERVEKWTEEAREWNPDILLLEGTSFSFDQEEAIEKTARSEKDVLIDFEEVMENHLQETIMINPYIRNVERLMHLDSTAEKSGRTFVWEENFAKVLQTFYPERKWTVLKESLKTESELIDGDVVSLEEIAESPEQYVLQNSYPNRDHLFHLKGGVYLHSNGEPLGDYDPRFVLLHEQLEQEGFEFISLGASGHASQEELITIAKTVDAKQTVPWHTFEPKRFLEQLTKNGLDSFLPEYDVEYTTFIK